MKKVIFALISPLLVVVSMSAFSSSDFSSLSILGHDEKQHKLADYRGKYVILEWINHDCPFIKKHYHQDYKNMQKLQQQAKKQDIVWISVNSSAKGKQGHNSIAKTKELYDLHGSHAAIVLLDEDGKLGRAFDAKTTPHMVILNKEGSILFDGAIDSNPSTDPKDIPGATNYIADAMAQLSNGNESFAVKKNKPYGCSVKY